MEKTTDEMLMEIAKYDYKCFGFPHFFLDYNNSSKMWSILWRNPHDFTNNHQKDAINPHEACKRALEFIKSNPQLFKKKL